MKIMAGDRCLIIHWLNLKARVDVKNDQLKAIKAALGLSRRHIHSLMFEIGFYFRSLMITIPIIKKAPIYLGHRCPAIRLICLPHCPELVTDEPIEVRDFKRLTDHFRRI
jgi:hypothetical protein